MVERLKAAIDKARAARDAAPGVAPRAAPVAPAAASPAAALRPGADWAALREVAFDQAHLTRSRIVTHDKIDPAHAVFDVLRTRILKVCRDNGWRRVGIGSATAACGKSLIACNLALSFARQSDLRTVLVDMDLRRPTLAGMLGIAPTTRMQDFLDGALPPERHFLRVGDNLALGLNAARVAASGELMQSARARESLGAMIDALRPDIVIHDMPPMLVGDDAIAFLGALDCMLIVASSGVTTAEHLRECERMLADHTPYLGVVLNKVEGQSVDRYADAYAEYRYR